MRKFSGRNQKIHHQDHLITHLTTGQWGTTKPFLLLLSADGERVGSTWDWSKISHFFPTHIISWIFSNKICNTMICPNRWNSTIYPQNIQYLRKTRKPLMTTTWKEPVNVENMQKIKKILSESISVKIHLSFWISRAKKEKNQIIH